ncbi:MAG: response regulator [Myxococcales bacterium]|nr:response regulator [Myxococcales bacterium]
MASDAPPDRVLVADPDPAERARLVAVIEQAAQELERTVVVDEASDGTTALTLWSEHPPRLVVCEVLLDGLSGLALLRRMKADLPSLPPVIFVTQMSRASDRYWGLRNGAHAYLAKPYDDGQLLGRIRDALHKGADAEPERPFD